MLAQHTLGILPLLRETGDRRFQRRPNELIAGLQVERRVLRHPPMQYEIRFIERAGVARDQIVSEDEIGIILVIADVIALGNEIKVPGPKFIFPFKARKAQL